MCDLKVTQINMKHTWIREILLSEFKLCHNTPEASKNICWEKDVEKLEMQLVTVHEPEDARNIAWL